MHPSTTKQLGYFAVIATVALALTAGFASIARANHLPPGATANTYVFDAALTGANQVPPVSATTSATTTATTTGHSRVWFETVKASTTATTTTMWHSLHVWNGEDIVMGHLHCGVPGQNGPVVADLFHNASSTDVNGVLVGTTSISNSAIHATTTGCAMPITNVSELAAALKAGIIYTNVHSVQYPAGVVRGQLMLTASSSTSTPPMATTTPPVGTTTPPHHGTSTPPLPGKGLGKSIVEFIRSLMADNNPGGIGREVSEFIRGIRPQR